MDQVTEKLSKVKLEDAKSSSEQQAGKRIEYDRKAYKKRLLLLERAPEQNILNVIQTACAETFERSDFGITLQSIKANFAQRDYEGIFHTSDAKSLQVYSAAYVPGRALCYYEIFCMPKISKLLARKVRIYAVGSGSGSELVSLMAAMTRVPADRQQIQLTMQDIGDYQETLANFEATARSAWHISPAQLEFKYIHEDILSPSDPAKQVKRIAKADLITFMFVMNELFVKKSEAMVLVDTLVKNMKKGAYLLVVESAGSFSHLKVGGKTYMLYTLLDAIKDFECVLSENSRWYRHPENLRFPIDIQDMRYFIRLYKKL